MSPVSLTIDVSYLAIGDKTGQYNAASSSGAACWGLVMQHNIMNSRPVFSPFRFLPLIACSDSFAIFMDCAIPIFKPSIVTAAPKSVVTSITPNNVGRDSAMERQLSDDAAAPEVPTVYPQDLKPILTVAPVPQVPEAEDAALYRQSLVSPFADAVDVPDSVDQTDSVGDVDPDTAMYHEAMLLAHSGSLDASRQHHLLRHSLPNEQRGHGVLSHFGVETISDAAKIIKKMSQRELQAKFKLVYGARTFSNNNNWLRRKLFEAIGLDPSKGAVKKPGGGTQRRRRPAKPAAPRAVGARVQRRAPRAEPIDLDNQPIAEALLALGELASLAYDGYDLDDLEEAAAAVEDGSGSDGRVPSTGDEPRLSWSAEDEGRGVPRAPTPTPEVATTVVPEEDVEELEVEEEAAVVAQQQEVNNGMGQMFEWIARMQRQAMEAAGPQHAAMMAAMMANAPVHAQQAQQVQALQMAAMAGHPHAQQLLHAMMASGAMNHPQHAAQMMPSPEMFHRMMQEAVAAAHHQQQQQAAAAHPLAAHMHKLMQQGGHLVPPMHVGPK